MASIYETLGLVRLEGARVVPGPNWKEFSQSLSSDEDRGVVTLGRLAGDMVLEVGIRESSPQTLAETVDKFAEEALPGEIIMHGGLVPFREGAGQVAAERAVVSAGGRG